MTQTPPNPVSRDDFEIGRAVGRALRFSPTCSADYQEPLTPEERDEIEAEQKALVAQDARDARRRADAEHARIRAAHPDWVVCGGPRQ